jgi:hypothetical protein
VRAAERAAFWYTENLEGFGGGGDALSLAPPDSMAGELGRCVEFAGNKERVRDWCVMGSCFWGQESQPSAAPQFKNFRFGGSEAKLCKPKGLRVTTLYFLQRHFCVLRRLLQT